jgi:hypothetical protein
MLAYEVVVYINAKKVRQVCAGPDGGAIFEFDGRHRGLGCRSDGSRRDEAAECLETLADCRAGPLRRVWTTLDIAEPGIEHRRIARIEIDHSTHLVQGSVDPN